MFKKLVLPLSLFFLSNSSGNIDLNIVGFLLSSDGLGRIPLSIIDCLKDYDIEMNFIPTRLRNFISPSTSLQVQRILNKDISPVGSVALYTDMLQYGDENHYKFIPEKSLIKIAYSMLESSAIPQEWVDILNNKFDSVVVPDEWLVNVYKNSGVKIPIFVLSLPLFIDDFLKKQIKIKKNKPFVFGNSCALTPKKNYIKLVEAFYKAFGNSSEVILKINGRRNENGILENIQKKINELAINNIEIAEKVLSQEEYLDFMASLDCFVSLSCGEGFAIPPRESLALSIPAIISDNTAHHTICKTGFVRSVPSNIAIPSTYFGFDNYQRQIGYSYDCTIDDAAQALKDVYENYQYYLNKAKKGREWVKQYLKENIQKKYLNLVKPKKVILGDRNIITENYLMTTSKSLSDKYQKIINENFDKKFNQKCIESIKNGYFINYAVVKKYLENIELYNPFFHFKNQLSNERYNNFSDFDLSMRFGKYKKNERLIYDDNDIKKKLDLYKNIYEKNVNLPVSVKNKIPKIIHQIWLGSQFPDEFKQITDKWLKMHPDWKYILWDDEKIKELFPLYNQKYFENDINLAEKSDILRYEILFRLGGVYVDTDYECFKKFDELIHKYNFFVGIQPLDAGPYDIGNAIIGSSANHPIIRYCVETIKDHQNQALVINKTGPGHLTRGFCTIAEFNDKEIIALPVSYLYPLGYYERDKKVDSKKILSEESFGIHYWSGTWYLKN